MFVHVAYALTFVGWAFFHAMQNHEAAHLAEITDRLIAGGVVSLVANGIVLWYVSGLMHDTPGKWRTPSKVFAVLTSVGVIVVQSQMIHHLTDTHERIMLGFAMGSGLISHIFAYTAGYTFKHA